MKCFTNSLFIVLLSISTLQAQDTAAYKNDDNVIQQQLENIAENTSSEEIDFTNLLDRLNYHRKHPINLNKTTIEELRELNLLNDIQINNLLTYIKENGSLMTIYELQIINGFDLQVINKILPYVYVSENFSPTKFSIKDLFKNEESTLLLRYGQVLEQQKGFKSIDSTSLANNPNSRYIGSPQKFYSRYNFNYRNKISFGITADKDQGELFFKDNQRFKNNSYEQLLNGNQHSGFDFYSAHLYIKNEGFVKTIVIGDYQATFGQGLTLWNGYAFGKSADIMSIKRVASGIRPYKSVDENNFLRGVATTFNYKNWEATTFFSHKKIDGNIIDTSATGVPSTISSLQQTGYHTTAGELYDKHSVTQTITGGNVTYKSRKLNIGITAIDYQLDKNFNRAFSPYNQFEFSAKHNFNFGIDYNYVLRNFNFFGEQALSKNGGMAFINGVLVYLDERFYFTIIHRNYQRNYQNLMSNAYSQNSSSANEKGIYTGVTVRPLKNYTLLIYYDRFEFPWLKYQVNAPSYGNEYAAQLNYTPSKKVAIYVRAKVIHKQKNTSTANAIIDYPVNYNQTNYRFNISYEAAPSVKLRSRVELVNYQLQGNKTQHGYLAYQDIIYNKMGSALSLTLRYALFETDSYDTRIYAYENDVQGYYSIPSYYYRGSRFYAMVNYNITRNMELWLRYSETFYDNRNIISEGSLTEINGNTKSEVRAQMMFKF
jgi:hypothetical protein